MERRTLLLVPVLLVAGGCYDSRVFGDGGDTTSDASTTADTGTPPPPPPPPPPPAQQLDLLFLMDNSGSMAEEQASLAVELPRLMAELSIHYSSIQAGVITSDMGVGGFTVPTCVNRDFGDDGILRTQGRTEIAGCMATYPRFLAWPEGSPSTDDIAFGIGCVARGTGGCGFEQQLEAVLKAVTPTSARASTAASFVSIGTPGAPDGLDVPFFRMTNPHGNVTNDGFVRDDSMLAIVMVTDEEDCSAKDLNLFDPASPTYSSTDLNLRCFAHPQALHPVSRYASGLTQLRRHPSRLAYFVIAGVPTDLAPGPGEPVNWDALISPDLTVRDERMQERVDPSMPNRLVPSCNVPGRGVAFAPVRIVQTAQQLEAEGARVGIGSICQESFASTLDSFVEVLTR